MTGPTGGAPSPSSSPLVSRLRIGVGSMGVALVAYGGWLVLSGGRSTDPFSVLLLTAVPIVVHDALLAPVVVVAGWCTARFVPATARAPLAAALVVAGSLTLVAAPLVAVHVLGRRPFDNPSVAPLDYPVNLAQLLAVVAVLTATWIAVRSVVRARRRRRAPEPG